MTLDIGISFTPQVPENGGYIGIDLNLHALDNARDEIGNRANTFLFAASGTALPLADKSITTVQAYNVLSDSTGVDIDYDFLNYEAGDPWAIAIHIRNMQLLNEVARVLKQGGILKLKQTMGSPDFYDGLANAVTHLRGDHRFLLIKTFDPDFADRTVSKHEFIRTVQD